MKHPILYVHGKGGSAKEAEHYSQLLPTCEVVGIDYAAKTPWEARAEFPRLLAALPEPELPRILIANSIGAYFSMCALPQAKIEKAFFISPVVNMEQLILDMMRWAGVSEADLREQKRIETTFGETLSWEYLCDVRSHPVRWEVPTEILYGAGDHLAPPQVIAAFADEHHAGLTVMPDGEHWFHTAEQMAFLDQWLSRLLQTDKTP